jgi:hypothetical protein
MVQEREEENEYKIEEREGILLLGGFKGCSKFNGGGGILNNDI